MACHADSSTLAQASIYMYVVEVNLGLGKVSDP